mgnify:FL=1
MDAIHADQLLAAANWDVKTAVVMALTGTSVTVARARLDVAHGHVRRALDDERQAPQDPN